MCSAHFSKGKHSQIQWDLDYVPHIFKNNFVKFKKKRNYKSTTNSNYAENTEESDKIEEIGMTGIDLPSQPDCSQLDFHIDTLIWYELLAGALLKIVRHIPLVLFAIRKLLSLINFSGIRYSHTKKQKELGFVKNVPEVYISWNQQMTII